MLCFPMPIFSLPEHKIVVFVRFWGLEPSFSGISSTKSGFLCFFGLRNPRFRVSRAQNRGFCALLGFGTLVFGRFEHKIGVFVRFWGLEPSFSGFLSTKSGFLCAFAFQNPHFPAFRAQNRHFCALLSVSFFPMAPPASNKPHQAEKYSGLASTLAYLGRMWLPPGRGAAAGWQMVLPDCAARKNLPLRCAGETAAALGLRHGRGRAALATMG